MINCDERVPVYLIDVDSYIVPSFAHTCCRSYDLVHHVTIDVRVPSPQLKIYAPVSIGPQAEERRQVCCHLIQNCPLSTAAVYGEDGEGVVHFTGPEPDVVEPICVLQTLQAA